MQDAQDFFHLSARADLPARPLVLLHGSGADEHYLTELGNSVAADRPCLAIRGPVAWESGYAFFRRHPDRSLDYDDLRTQTERFADFLDKAVKNGALRQPPILLGFSNGAILAASVLLRRPEAIAGAILLRPLTPRPSAVFPDLRKSPTLVIAADRDERRAPQDFGIMQKQLEDAGSNVTGLTLDAGHRLTEQEMPIIRDWLADNFPPG